MRRVRLSGGHRAFLEAIEAGFSAEVDYAQLIKNQLAQIANRRRSASANGSSVIS